MADNVDITAGTGTTIAADEVTRNATLEKQQIIKLSLGADGDFDTLVDSGQQTMVNSIPVVLASDQGAVPISASSLPLPSGAVTSANQITIIGHVDGIEGLLTTIDSDTSTLVGTDFMLGTDFSNVLGTTSLVLATQADDIVNTSDGIQTSSFLYVFDGITWDRLRGDSTDGILVNLGTNNDVTVTGSVTANAGTNLNTSLLALETGGNLATIAGAVSGTEMQVDVITMPTTTVTATNLDIRDLTQASDSVLIYGSDDGGTTKRVIKTDAGGAIQVDLEVDNVDITSLPTVTGAGSFTTVEDAVTLTLGGAANTAWQITGTWAGVISFEASIDGTNWVAIWGYQSGTTTIVQATTVNGIFRCTTAGFAFARARYSTDTSGTAVVTGYASHGTSGVFLNFPQYGGQMLGKQEDVASADADTGVGMMAVQKATPANTAGTDGDYEFLQMSAGRLWTSAIVTSIPAITATDLDIRNLTSTDVVTVTGGAGQTADVKITLDSEAVTVNAHAVTNAGTFVVQENGAALTALQLIDDAVYAEDVASQAADKGIAVLAIRDDTLDARSTTEGDYEPFHTNANGALWTVDVNSSAIATSLGNLDNSVDGNYLNVNMNIAGTDVSANAGILDATTLRVTIATDDEVNNLLGTIDTDTGNIVTAVQIMDDWDNGASDGASVSGDVADNIADAGEPVKIGGKAFDLGANPAALAASDRVNATFTRAGQLFTIGGHPNIITKNLQITDADGAQTDTAIVTVAAGTAIVVTSYEVTADNANTGDVSCRIGFGTANTPAADAAGVIMFHPGIASGSGVVRGDGSGILGIGASDEDLRVTCEDPAGGSISITITYYTILIG